MSLHTNPQAVPHESGLQVCCVRDSDWLGPALPFDTHQTDLWITDEARLAPLASALEATLRPDELARARRLVRAEDGRRFMLFRGALRCLLARYMGGLAPDSLAFMYGPHGKPILNGPHPIQFNLSHAGDRMALAVSQHPVGVDIEQMDRATDVDAVASRFYLPGEAASLAQLAPEQRRILFYRWWTAKEAALKAWGVGLGSGKDYPDFSRWRTGATAQFATGPSGCTGLIQAFPSSSDWAGALVVDARLERLLVRDVTGWWTAAG